MAGPFLFAGVIDVAVDCALACVKLSNTNGRQIMSNRAVRRGADFCIITPFLGSACCCASLLDDCGRAAPQTVSSALFSRVHRRIRLLEQRFCLLTVEWRQRITNSHAHMAGVLA